MRLTILADDLTGACDTGALFAGRGLVAVALALASPTTAGELLVLDTESRSLPPSAAARRVEEALSALPAERRGGLFFKKIDSTLRGPVGAEVEALLRTTGTRSALLCPTFPAQGRSVVGRILTADGRPVHETALGRDPDFPAQTSDVVQILKRQVDRPVSWLSLAQIRERHAGLTAALSQAGDALVVADAETDEDLERLVDAALVAAPRPLLVGSAGLARAVAARLGCAGPAVPLPAGPAWLIVAGSHHPATHAQVAALEAAHMSGARLTPDAPPREAEMRRVTESLRSGRPAFLAVTIPSGVPPLVDRRRTAATLARVVAQILEEVTPILLVLIGGETAVAVYQALKAEAIEIAGAPRPGLALGHLRGGDKAGLALLTKAGGFGPPDLFLGLGREMP